MSGSHLSSYVYQLHRGFSSHRLKHSSAVFLSRFTPPPPRMAGRSPPTHSASLRTQPAPDLVLVRVLESGLFVPRLEGVQNPSPVPQKPKLEHHHHHHHHSHGASYSEQQLSSPAQSPSAEQVSWPTAVPRINRNNVNLLVIIAVISPLTQTRSVVKSLVFIWMTISSVSNNLKYFLSVFAQIYRLDEDKKVVRLYLLDIKLFISIKNFDQQTISEDIEEDCSLLACKFAHYL